LATTAAKNRCPATDELDVDEDGGAGRGDDDGETAMTEALLRARLIDTSERGRGKTLLRLAA
jgi:hypothetical protein